MKSPFPSSNGLIVFIIAIATAILVFQSRSQISRWWLGKRADVSYEISLLQVQVAEEYYDKREDKYVTKPECWTVEDETELKRLEDLYKATRLWR